MSSLENAIGRFFYFYFIRVPQFMIVILAFTLSMSATKIMIINSVYYFWMIVLILLLPLLFAIYDCFTYKLIERLKKKYIETVSVKPDANLNDNIIEEGIEKTKNMEDAKEYWEEMLAITVLILTTYIITKDLIIEKTVMPLTFLNSNTISAIIYAGFVDIVIISGFVISYFLTQRRKIK